MNPVPALIRHAHGIHTLDAEYLRPGLAAIHLMLQQGRAAIIDTGTALATPRTLEALAGLGLGPEAVDYVIVTHVHLDHAGAAGNLMRACPRARLVVHPKGARHLIDPAKLIQGATAVYGAAAFREHYGEILPVPEARVIVAEDGFSLDFHGRRLDFIDTPGHARHHFCIHDRASNSLFTGDTFGISYREFDAGDDARPFVFPTTTPVQFEPEALHASIDKLLSRNAAAAFLTHYGRVADLPALAPGLHQLIDEFVALALAAPGTGPARHAWLYRALEDSLVARLQAHGCALPDAVRRELLASDVELNTQGLLVWRDREAGG